MKLDAKHVLGAIGLGVAAGVAYLATKGTGPVKLTQFTESRTGPVQAHLATAAELGMKPPPVQHRYPGQVAPGLYQLISQGYAPLYQLPDPQAAALPAEAAV